MKKAVHKNVTIDDLAAMVANGFSSIDKKFDEVGKRFDKVDKRFDKVEKDIVELKENLEKVEENLNTTRMDVLGIGDKFVSKHEFSQHLVRFSLLEQKVKTRR